MRALGTQVTPELSSLSDPRRHREAASWFAVVRAYLDCDRRYAQMLEHFGLTVMQFEVLSVVHRLGDAAAPKTIAEQLLVTRANISGVLARLKASGLITTRAAANDGRSLICSLTPAGQTLTQRARAASARFIRAQLAPFDDSELGTVEALMRRMRTHLASLDPEQLAAGQGADMSKQSSYNQESA